MGEKGHQETYGVFQFKEDDAKGSPSGDRALHALLTNNQREIVHQQEIGAIPKNRRVPHRVQITGRGHYRHAHIPGCE